jgi:hypothetical protein
MLAGIVKRLPSMSTTADGPASASVATFLKNREHFFAIPRQSAGPVILSPSLSCVVYGVEVRAQGLRQILTPQTAHPRHRANSDVSADQITTAYDESKAVLHLGSIGGDNPPLHLLKPPKGKDTVYLDAGNCFFPNHEAFRHISRFAAIKYLSLRNCGLTEVPADLATSPPKKLRFLDLSMNYIGQLPQKMEWTKILGLNLSENAIAEWPFGLVPDAIPKLGVLILSGNPFPGLPNFATGFTNLRYLDVSSTRIPQLPQWIWKCKQLKVLRCAGAALLGEITAKSLTELPKLRFVDLSGTKEPEGDDFFEVKEECELFIFKGLSAYRLPRGTLATVN